MFMLLFVSLSLRYVNGDQQSIEKLELTSRQAEESVQLGKDGKEGKIEKT